MQYYAITHLTRYSYSDFITASMMELRMQPRSEGFQTCLDFTIKLSPKARLFNYRDNLNNHVHFFDIPGQHRKLAISADSLVEMRTHPDLPERLPDSAWYMLHPEHIDRDCFDMLRAGRFTEPTALTQSFAESLGLRRRDDPLTVLTDLNAAIYASMDYDATATEVDSPMDVALEHRKGVCQDFAHIMATLTRGLGIPCRYVSGYLFHRVGGYERSAVDASHAWVEAWLPELGWIGFDPTNNLICGDRHIRVSIGRDYADAAPTRGVFAGSAETSLEVSVRVEHLDARPEGDSPSYTYDLSDYENQHHQQQ